MNALKKTLAAATLAATAFVASTPAMAEHRNGGETAAIAIGAGIVGLAIGAILSKRDRYDDRYHVRDGWYYRDGYYYDRGGRYYTRNDWQRRYARHYRHDRRWDRHDRRWSRHERRAHRDYRRGYGDRYYGRRGY
jgi:hypothetical protein